MSGGILEEYLSRVVAQPGPRQKPRDAATLILLDRSVIGIDCDLVQADSAGGAERLVRHLIGIGHRRALFGLLALPGFGLGALVGGGCARHDRLQRAVLVQQALVAVVALGNRTIGAQRLAPVVDAAMSSASQARLLCE